MTAPARNVTDLSAAKLERLDADIAALMREREALIGQQPIRSYREHLALRARPPLPADLRTRKEPGHLEIVVDPKTGKERLHRYGEAA